MEQPLFRIAIAFFFIQLFGLSREGQIITNDHGMRPVRDVNLRDVLAIPTSGDGVNQRQRGEPKIAYSTNIYMVDYLDAASYPRKLLELKASSELIGLHTNILFKIKNRDHVPKQIIIQRVNDNACLLVANAPLVLSEEQKRTGSFPIFVEAVGKDNPDKKAGYVVNVNLEDIQQKNAQRSTPMPGDQHTSILTDRFLVPTGVDLSPFLNGYNQRLDKLSERCYVNFRAFNDTKEDFKEMEDQMKVRLDKKTQECEKMELDLRAQLAKKQKELIQKEGQIADLQTQLKKAIKLFEREQGRPQTYLAARDPHRPYLAAWDRGARGA